MSAAAAGAFSHINSRLKKYLNTFDLYTLRVSKAFEHGCGVAVQKIEFGKVDNHLIAAVFYYARCDLFQKDRVFIQHLAVDAKDRSVTVRKIYLCYLRSH